MKNNKKDSLKILEQPPSVSCCSGPKVGIKQIEVGGIRIGITGLDEIFKRYLETGTRPEELNADHLVEEISKINYISEGSEEVYKDALLKEYRRYYEGKK